MQHDLREQHKHVMDEGDLTPYQKFVSRVLWRIFELSTMELVIAILHCALTAAAVFGLIGASGGEGGH